MISDDFPSYKPPFSAVPARKVADAWTNTPEPSVGRRPRAPVEAWVETGGKPMEKELKDWENRGKI